MTLRVKKPVWLYPKPEFRMTAVHGNPFQKWTLVEVYHWDGVMDELQRLVNERWETKWLSKPHDVVQAVILKGNVTADEFGEVLDQAGVNVGMATAPELVPASCPNDKF